MNSEKFYLVFHDPHLRQRIFFFTRPKGRARRANWACHLNYLEAFVYAPFTMEHNEHTMDYAADRADLSLIKFLYKNGVRETTSVGMNWAAQRGRLEVIQWFHEKGIGAFTPNTMDVAAAKGHLDVVRWLHETRAEGCTWRAIRLAANNGHYEVVQWLFEHCPGNYADWDVEEGNKPPPRNIEEIMAYLKAHPQFNSPW